MKKQTPKSAGTPALAEPKPHVDATYSTALAAEKALDAQSCAHIPKPTKMQIIEAGALVLALKRADRNRPKVQQICDLIADLSLTFEKVKLDFLIKRMQAYAKRLAPAGAYKRLRTALGAELADTHMFSRFCSRSKIRGQFAARGPLTGSALGSMLRASRSTVSIYGCIDESAESVPKERQEIFGGVLGFPVIVCRELDVRTCGGKPSKKVCISAIVGGELRPSRSNPKLEETLEDAISDGRGTRDANLPPLWDSSSLLDRHMVSVNPSDSRAACVPLWRAFVKQAGVPEKLRELQALLDALEATDAPEAIVEFAQLADSTLVKTSAPVHRGTIDALAASAEFQEVVEKLDAPKRLSASPTEPA